MSLLQLVAFLLLLFSCQPSQEELLCRSWVFENRMERERNQLNRPDVLTVPLAPCKGDSCPDYKESMAATRLVFAPGGNFHFKIREGTYNLSEDARHLTLHTSKHGYSRYEILHLSKDSIADARRGGIRFVDEIFFLSG